MNQKVAIAGFLNFVNMPSDPRDVEQRQDFLLIIIWLLAQTFPGEGFVVLELEKFVLFLHVPVNSERYGVDTSFRVALVYH